MFGFSPLMSAAKKLGALALMLMSVGLVLQADGQSIRKTPTVRSAPSTPRGRVIEIDKIQALIPDVKVMDQKGRRVSLYTDLIKDKVVLLSFFFTTCADVCPVQGEVLSQVQSRLAKQSRKDVFLISISLDPAQDTPDKLKDWAKSFGVKPGWTLVSSKSPEMQTMIRAFTGSQPGPKDMHFPVFFIGNDRTERWVAINGLSGAENVVDVIEEILTQADINTQE
jgi:protein SCO1/2